MTKIIKNELYKFFKSNKNIILISLFLIYLLGISFYNINRYKLYMKEQKQVYMNRSAKADGVLSSKTLLLNKYDDLSLKEKETINREVLEKEKEFYNEERNKLLLMAYTYGEDNPKKYKDILIAENARYKNIIKGIEEKVINPSFLKDRDLTMEEVEKKSYINKYILDNEIQPILNPYTMTGANSLVMFLEGNNLLILIFLIALLSVDIYLGEIEEGSYKLSYNQPFGRGQLYLGKVITITIVSLLLITLAVLLNFIIISVIYGIGNMRYPFITSENIMNISFSISHREYVILPLWKYAVMGFGLLLTIVIFTISLVMCISIFVDSSTKTLGFSMILLVLAFIFNNFVPKESIVNLIYPYCYLFIRNVIEINNRSNYLFGVLLNSLLTIGLFIISYNKFINKDFLGAKE